MTSFLVNVGVGVGVGVGASVVVGVGVGVVVPHDWGMSVGVTAREIITLTTVYMLTMTICHYKIK